MSGSISSSSHKLKNICDLIMNMDSRVRFAGVLDNDGMLVEGGMRKNILSLLQSEEDDLFYVRTVLHLKELRDFTGKLGDINYVLIKMDKISFVSLRLKNDDGNDKFLLVSMEPDAEASFIIPSIKNALVE